MGTVELRARNEKDFEIIFPMTQDPIANEMAKVYPRTRAQFKAQWDTRSDHPACLLCIILYDGQVVGRINSFPKGDETHVGYLIARAHWGKGIMSEALRLFVERIEQRPLIARAAISNIGSCRVLEKCAFVKVSELESPEDERYVACIEAHYRLDSTINSSE